LEPVLILGAIILVYGLGKVVISVTKKVPTLMQDWEITCLTMGLFAVNFLFFPVSSTAINAFRCTADPVTGIQYNSAYPYVECDAIPLGNRIVALILYSGGILTIFSTLLVTYNRSEPGSAVETLIQKSFGFFFQHFKKKYNYFAIIVLCRRFVLSLLISLIKVQSVLSFGLVCAVLFGYSAVAVLVQPFKTQRDNYLEVITVLASVFAYGLALTLSLDDLNYGSIVATIIYFMLNIVVIVWCAIEFIRSNFSQVVKLFIKVFIRSSVNVKNPLEDDAAIRVY